MTEYVFHIQDAEDPEAPRYLRGLGRKRVGFGLEGTMAAWGPETLNSVASQVFVWGVDPTLWALQHAMKQPVSIMSSEWCIVPSWHDCKQLGIHETCSRFASLKDWLAASCPPGKQKDLADNTTRPPFRGRSNEGCLE